MASKQQPTIPKRADGIAVISLLFAILCIFAAFGTASLVRSVLQHFGIQSLVWEVIFAVVIAATALLLVPAIRALRAVSLARTALASSDIVTARIATSEARDHAWLSMGWGVFALLLFGLVCFVLMNDIAVGKTFFYLPLMQEKWWLVTRQFLINNIFIFVVAEILVLIWGLIVALARLMPGPAGQPIRALAILYCDVFRGLPAIVTLYLIGFGIPTSGIPDLIVPHIVGMFVDLSAMSTAEARAATRIPVSWWCILALTLTYGAYVAEVYRAGIESIHWSQVSAARSLGLSYMQTMRYVVVPQAVRRIMAPLLNDFIGLQKDTALVQVVGVIDAFNQSRIIAANAFNLSAVTVVAILFVIITIPQARFVDRLIERDTARMRAGADMSFLEIRNVEKEFGSHKVLRGINMSVNEHQVVCLIGPSGCGKSTLLRCINGLEKIQGGEIRLDNDRVSGPGVDVNRLRQQVGIVFQSFNLFPHMSVIENVTLAPTKVLKVSEAEARDKAMALLKRIGLEAKANEYPDRLSGGQQQRVAIVRALAMEPRVMLLDEITSALDPELVSEVLNIVRDLAQQGMTMLLATHEMGFAREVASKVCFLYDGVVHEEGPPAKIFGDPSEERTRAFLKRIIEAGRL